MVRQTTVVMLMFGFASAVSAQPELLPPIPAEESGSPHPVEWPLVEGRVHEIQSARHSDRLTALPGPVITSVHECGQPLMAARPEIPVLIRDRRFLISVTGYFEPAGKYDLIAYFDGEEIGRARIQQRAAVQTFATSTEFPPGRYQLTVRSMRHDTPAVAMPSPSITIDYQPTYVRDMRRLHCLVLPQSAQPARE